MAVEQTHGAQVDSSAQGGCDCNLPTLNGGGSGGTTRSGGGRGTGDETLSPASPYAFFFSISFALRFLPEDTNFGLDWLELLQRVEP